MSKDFLVIDFEFTQYTKHIGKPRAFFSEIIEIGVVKIAADTLEITGHIQNFVKPHFFPKQAKESMAFCSITETDMKSAIDFKTMLQKLTSLYTPGTTYFVSWGNDDYKVVKEGCERHELPNPILPQDCLDLAAAYKLLKGETRTIGLLKAAEELEINTDGHTHAAYDDAVNASRILLKLMEDGWKPDESLN